MLKNYVSDPLKLDHRLPDLHLVPKVNLSKVIVRDCLINADSDLEAIHAWLKQFDNQHTRLAYQKDVTRFIIWCGYIGGKHLDTIKLDDLEKYQQFLADVPPHWLAKKNSKRFDVTWRPFKKSLSHSAIQASMVNLKSLFSFLFKTGYITKNPMAVFKVKNKDLEEQKFSTKARMLEQHEWCVLQEVLRNLSEEDVTARRYKAKVNLAFALLYILGLRIAEAASAEWQNFKIVDGRWWFFIKGKGGKLGQIPVNAKLLEIVANYRSIFGLDIPLEQDSGYIFANAQGNMGSSRVLYNIVKHISAQAAQKFDKNSASYKKLMKLSPHWLRHLSASHQDILGLPLNMIRDNHRHSSINTTQIYMHTEDLQRHELMQQHQLQVMPVEIDDNTAVLDEPSRHKLTIQLKRGPIDFKQGMEVVVDFARKLVPKDADFEVGNKEFSIITTDMLADSMIEQIKLIAKIWLFSTVIEHSCV